MGGRRFATIGLLQAAAARPGATAFGEDAYPDLDRKAAALLHSIATGHPLMDGMAIAAGALVDVTEIAGHLAGRRVDTRSP